MSSHKQNFSWALQKEWVLTIRRWYSRCFPGRLVVSAQCFPWCGPGFNTWLRKLRGAAKKKKSRFFGLPAGPMAKVLCGVLRFDPWSGNQTPLATTQSLHSATKRSPWHNLRSHIPHNLSISPSWGTFFFLASSTYILSGCRILFWMLFPLNRLSSFNPLRVS